MSDFSWLVLAIAMFVIGGLIGVLWEAQRMEENQCDHEGGCDNCCGDKRYCDDRNDEED